EYFAINLRFHHAIVAAARNSVLMNNFQTTSLAMQRLRYSANLDRTRARWSQAVREHEEMLGALRERNGKELGDIMLRHLRHKSDAVIDWLAHPRRESTAA